jgi:hypothetical protein
MTAWGRLGCAAIGVVLLVSWPLGATSGAGPGPNLAVSIQAPSSGIAGTPVA